MGVHRSALVTGATGFIGRHLVRRLRADGWRVRALLRGDPASVSIEEDVEAVAGDLTRPSSLQGAASGVDAVFHAACATASTFASDREAERLFLRINRDGTEAIAREAARARARLVHISSTAAMGLGDGREVVDEGTACNPISPYGRSKLAAEQVVGELVRDEGLEAVMVRPCMVAGPGKRGGEVRNLIRMAGLGLVPLVRGSEDAIKPIVYVEDVVSALVLAFEKGTPGGVYLVTDGEAHTVREIIEAAGRVAGRRRPALPVPSLPLDAAAAIFEGVRKRIPSFNPPITRGRLELLRASRRFRIDRARRDLGYEPAWTDVEEMLGLSV
jgi:nucleoside-diphosphate-sugar epimerase